MIADQSASATPGTPSARGRMRGARVRARAGFRRVHAPRGLRFGLLRRVP